MDKDVRFLVRQVEIQDYKQLCELADEVGYGFTSFPKDYSFLEAKIERAVNSFKGEETDEPLYFFVLEEVTANKIIGFCGIEAKVGVSTPFYNFKISSVCQVSESLDKQITHKFLHSVNDYEGVSELVSLFLAPEGRGHRRGECLSRSRFLYMAMFPDKFSEEVIAEIRGVSDERGTSPFWEHVGKRFFDMDFIDADLLSVTTNKQFLSDLLPREPIYVDLIHPEAAKVIGVPHGASSRAMHLLGTEGFAFRNYVDVFDAGPVISARRMNIKTTNNTKKLKIVGYDNKISTQVIMASNKEKFMATLGCGSVEDENIRIDEESAKILNVNINDYVYVTKIY